MHRSRKPASPFRYFHSSPEVIRLVVMMYVRFPLSLRNVEVLLIERGIDICHETVRLWWNRFGPMFAADIRRQRVNRMKGFRHWRWHLDEVYVKIDGEMHYLWRTVDHEGEILNAVLFLLIGLEVVLITGQPRLLLFGLAAIPLALFARWLSVRIPLTLLRSRIDLGALAVPTLVWGGLRGGISIALALSLPNGPYRTSIVAATFVIVLFSVIIQGGSIGGLIGRLGERKQSRGEGNK